MITPKVHVLYSISLKNVYIPQTSSEPMAEWTVLCPLKNLISRQVALLQNQGDCGQHDLVRASPSSRPLDSYIRGPRLVFSGRPRFTMTVWGLC